MNNQLTKLKSQKREEGFTIIEVMIVLAIAGLILLVVFLAVPALQRSARNNQVKTDAAALSSAVTEYKNNNDGALPTTAANITGLAKTNPTTVVALNVTPAAGAAYTAAQYSVTVYTNGSCGAAGAVTYALNKTATYYTIETPSLASKCIDN